MTPLLADKHRRRTSSTCGEPFKWPRRFLSIGRVHFARGQRKDEETQRRLKDFTAEEGVLYIGVAQEKFAGFRVMKKISPQSGTAFPLQEGPVTALH